MIQTFLSALTNADKDGRILLRGGDSDDTTTIKYMLLNPEEHFRDIVEESRAVVLAGGTMAPVRSFFFSELFFFLFCSFFLVPFCEIKP